MTNEDQEKRKLKVLVIHNTYSDVGGAEVFVRNTNEELRRRGHDVSLFSFGPKKIEEDNLVVVKESKFKFIRNINGVFIHIKGYLRLNRMIKEFNPDVIHLHNVDRYIATILLPIKKKRVMRSIYDFGIVCPTMWGIHKDDSLVCEQGIGLKCVKHKCISPLAYPIHRYLFLIKYKLQKKKVNSYAVVTNRLSDYMKEQGFSNTDVFPYCTNKQVDKIKLNDDKIMLFIGNLEKNKGVEYAIRMMPIVIKDVPEAKLVILGGGSERESLEKLSDELKVKDNVVFAGKVPNKEVDSYYEKSSIVVIPSIWMENSPIVIYEALALGKPVITSDRGGNPELIDEGVYGFVTKAGDHHKMAECAIQLLSDKKMLKSFSENALLASKKYTMKKYVDNIERMYFELMDKINE